MVARRFSPEQELEIADLYQKGRSLRALGRRYKAHKTVILKLLERHSVKLRPRGGQPKYTATHKWCPECKRSRAHKFFHGNRSRSCGLNYICKDCLVHHRRMSLYGLSLEQYDELKVKQRGRCAICRIKWTPTPRYPDLVVDHCHKSKKVRGLLCPECNSFLGLAKDRIKNLVGAIRYLSKG